MQVLKTTELRGVSVFGLRLGPTCPSLGLENGHRVENNGDGYLVHADSLPPTHTTKPGFHSENKQTKIKKQIFLNLNTISSDLQHHSLHPLRSIKDLRAGWGIGEGKQKKKKKNLTCLFIYLILLQLHKGKRERRCTGYCT